MRKFFIPPAWCAIIVALCDILCPGKTTALLNTAVEVGSPFTLTGGITNVTYWWEYVTSEHGSLLAEAGKVNDSHPWEREFNLTQDGEQEALVFAEADKKFAGKYGLNNSRESDCAEVVILENLMCSSRLEENMTDVVEGDNVTLICNVTYYGNWEPRLEWEDVRDEWCKPQQPQCDNSSCTLTRSCTILAKDSDHDRNLSCKMTFTNESMASGDPPSFTTGCKESLNVQYFPRNTVINVEEAEKGDTLHCDSQGNPHPHIFWHYGDKTRDETYLNLTEDILTSLRGSQIVCVATNIIRGEVRTDIAVFTIRNDPVEEVDKYIIAGVLAAVILILLIVIVILSVKRRQQDKKQLVAMSSITSATTLKTDSDSDTQVEIVNETPQVTPKPAVRYTSFPKNGKSRTLPNPGVTNHAFDPGPSPTISVRSVTQSKWELDRDDITLDLTIGTGSFGMVYHAEARGLDKSRKARKVAVKTLKANASRKDASDLRMELETMKLLPEHDNIIKLHGCCAYDEPMYIVMELATGGSLRSHLIAHRANAQSDYGNLQTGSNLHEDTLMEYAIQVGKAMAHLSHHKLIHRHLAAQHVLMTEDNICKLSDFGLTREALPHHDDLALSRYPVRWMAPESILNSSFSTEGDVWSFGILLWEIVTMAARPYAGKTNAEVITALKNYETMDQPTHCGDQLFTVMQKCWRKDPKSRPSFVTLVEDLHELGSEGEQLYLDLIDEDIYAEALC